MSLPPAPDLKDRTVGRYRVLGSLGRGGMGLVYRAEDPRLGREVALKLLPEHLSADPHAKERLLVEARAASALDHPHICTVYEVGEAEGGRLFLAMACYDGQTLAEALAERGPLPVDEAVAIARQVASGLAAAHRKGIVHRDVKPSNLFLCAREEGQGPHVKILDFGVAKVAGVDLTQPGGTVGTVAYAAPEQARGERVDGRADLWALGVVLYETLAGHRPFAAPYDAALLNAIQFEAPEPLRRHRPEVPEAVEAVVMRLLEKDPAARFQTAEEAGAALGAALEGRKPQALRRRPRWAVPAAGAASLVPLLALAFALRGVLLPGGPALPEERHIAVLPFAVVGGDAESAVFSAGIVEMLASGLTQLERYQGALWVVPMSEVRAQDVTSARAARSVLGANLVVTGSVQRDSTRVRIPLNLVDAVTLRQLASRTLEAPVGELNTLQGEVVAALAQMLNLEVHPEVQHALTAGGTTVPGAYDFYIQGLGYLQRHASPEDIENAIALFERALTADPDFALAHARLSEAHLRRYGETNDPAWVERAEASSTRAIALNDREPSIHVMRSRLFETTGRYEEAVQAARRALTLDPTSNEAFRALALAYENRGELGRAEEAFLAAIRAKPSFWLGYNNLGAFYVRQGRYDEAIAQFRQVTRLAPDNYRGYLNLGGAYLYLERLTDARAMFERAMALRPSYSGYSNLASLYVLEGRYAEAAETYRRALTLNDADHIVWGNLGDALRQVVGHEGEAADAYREAIRRAEAQLEVNRADVPVLTALGLYYVGVGDTERAREAVRRALTLQPPSPETAAYAATVFERTGDRDEALHWIAQALAGGYPRAWIEGDDDLAALRADPRYHALQTEAAEP